MLAPLMHPLLFSPLTDRAVASVLQGGCPGEQFRGEEALGMHSQHYVSKTTNLREFIIFYSFLNVVGLLES